MYANCRQAMNALKETCSISDQDCLRRIGISTESTDCDNELRCFRAGDSSCFYIKKDGGKCQKQKIFGEFSAQQIRTSTESQKSL